MVRIDVTLNVTPESDGLLTWDNIDLVATVYSARRADRHPMMHRCGMFRTGPAKPMGGHNEDPFLDGRGLRVGPRTALNAHREPTIVI